MVEYRKARADERKALIEFADLVFDFYPIFFEPTLPKVYGADADYAWIHNIAYDADKGIRAMVACLPNDLHVGEAVLKTGYIGTVSVHRDARGEGHMKKLMAMADEEMRKSGVDLSLLNGRRQRYEHFGYAMGGAAYRFELGVGNVQYGMGDSDPAEIEFVPLTEGSDFEKKAAAMHAALPIHFDRARFAVNCMSYEKRPWAAVRNEEMIGWVVADGKKTTLTEVEAGSADDLDAILKAWIAQRELDDISVVSVMVPGWRREFVLRLSRYAELVQLQHSAQVRVYNHAKVIEAFMKVKTGFEKLADGCMSFVIGEERFSVEVTGGEVKIGECGEHPIALTPLEADRLMFYPHNYEGRIETPDNWFPLPLYVGTPDAF